MASPDPPRVRPAYVAPEQEAIARTAHQLALVGRGVATWLVVGTVANWILRGRGPLDAFAFTVETLAFLTERQHGVARGVQVMLMVGGAVVYWFGGWMLLDLSVSGYWARYYKERKRMRAIADLSGHWILCGGGRVGGHLAELLGGAGHAVVVVEHEAAVAEEARRRGWLVMEGDAVDDAVLVAAGVARAKGLAAVMPGTEQNLLVVLAARELAPSLTIYARTDRPELARRFERAGADRVFLPEWACAEQIRDAVAGGATGKSATTTS